MTLFFLRHARADERENGQDHPERRLTSAGVDQAKRMGAFAHGNGFAFTAVLSSPYRRARETADLFAAELPWAPAVELADWLAIGTPAPTALREIAARVGCGNVLLVGHEPDFSTLIGALLGLNPAAIKIRKASLTCLDCVDARRGRWQLRWSVTPGLLGGAGDPTAPHIPA